MTKLQEYKDLQQQVVQLREKKASLAEKVIKEIADNFFFKYPEVEKFMWTQFTPYFNDGDTCTFEVHTEDMYVLTKAALDNRDYSKDEWDYEEFYLEWNSPMRKDLVLPLCNIDNEDYLEIFGDHVKVIIGREGMKVVECEHD